MTDRANQPPWLQQILSRISEQNPDAARLFHRRSFTAPLHQRQRQGVWFMFHEAFHLTEHRSALSDAEHLSDLIFADLIPEPEPEADFHSHITNTALNQARQQFAQRLSRPTTEPEFLSEPYENALRWSEPGYHPSPDEENRIARLYTNHELFRAFGDVTRHSIQNPELPLAHCREHFHAFVLQRVANAVDNTDAHFDLKHTEELCRKSHQDALRLIDLLEGAAIYEPTDRPRPTLPPEPNLTSREGTEVLETILYTEPAVQQDWREFVTSARTAVLLTDRSEIQRQSAHQLLTILLHMIWPPTD